MDDARIAADNRHGDVCDAGVLKSEHAAQSPRHRVRHTLLRAAADAIIAFVLFAFVSAGLMSAPSSANPGPAVFDTRHETVSTLALKAIGGAGDRPVVEIATTSSPANADAVYRRTSVSAAWVLLAIAFSAVFAMNLAVLRHVRHAYADPRKRPLLRKPEA